MGHVHIFFQKCFAEIRPEFNLSSTWPGELAINQMMERAAGLFVWAKTAMEKKEEGNPPSKLQLILVLCALI